MSSEKHFMASGTRRLGLSMLLCLSACSLSKPEPLLLFDLGPTPSVVSRAASPGALPPVLWVDVSAPSWLASTGIAYRLDYADPLRREVYRDSRWAAPPAALLAERLRQRLAAESTPAATRAATVPMPLRLELEEFGQSFASPSQSQVRIRVRARFGDGPTQRQQVFDWAQPAPSADARGAVQGLSQASDQLLGQVLAWLSSTAVN
ncbi:ABC-type transport auxiliary lipoprotein family protein [Paucibacter sp. Y2R2-4]|uniref:ABC-type transport auxiliary lipoprotein family protein n=1 Tax=Paucibacter sp. Y2R2-4 TaxID=2893553 RepID=UPI0021E4F973|nr:ABC-type transport auxiliary lipoprotein family protein [Paucibacter sp. Y2R2-4]MCV2351759.1 ABC-type transport auxiliary lipoprotein family protein [Paucibacter sp. Y2R2-4]